MTTERPTELKLVFDEPVQRKKAPKHLADFSPSERKAFAKELGFQPFRAAQVATLSRPPVKSGEGAVTVGGNFQSRPRAKVSPHR